MNEKVISKDNIPDFLTRLMGEFTVVAPMDRGKSPANFMELKSGDRPIIDGSKMTMPPKDYFLPRYEVLLKVNTEKGHESVEQNMPTSQQRVMLGVWLPDAQALKVLDKVFLDDKYKDPYYAARRENTAIVAVIPATLRWSWFCNSTDDVDSWKDSADVLMYDLGDRFVMEPISERGAKITELAQPVDAVEEDKVAASELWKHIAGMSKQDFAEQPLFEQLCWDDPVWVDIAARCVSCGTCTYMCPSCSCFDIQDESHDGCTERYRCRDTCQFSEFTLMGAGHNPRTAQMPRSRQRLLHKFKYQHEQFGVVACTGCGRCVELCPVNIDIRAALNRTCALPVEEKG